MARSHRIILGHLPPLTKAQIECHLSERRSAYSAAVGSAVANAAVPAADAVTAAAVASGAEVDGVGTVSLASESADEQAVSATDDSKPMTAENSDASYMETPETTGESQPAGSAVGQEEEEEEEEETQLLTKAKKKKNKKR